MAVAPSETVISHTLRPDGQSKPTVKAVAALLQKDDSGIVTLASSGIDRPAKLDGKRYASYAARFEGRIVQEMIKADGGTGDYEELALPMLGLWDTVLSGQADATWVFMGWEGVEAAKKGVELNVFKLEDYGVAYGYSPVLLASADALETRGEVVRAFLAGAAKGYEWAAANSEEAAALMADAVAADFPELPTPLDRAVLKGSVEAVAKCSLTPAGTWGAMEAGRWDAFLDWLSAQGLLTTKVQSRGPAGPGTTSLDGLRGGDAGDVIARSAVSAATLFTNDFLP